MRFDALAMKFSEIRFKRRADCPCCSELRHSAPRAPTVCADAVPSKPGSLAEERYIKPRVLKQLLERHSSADVLLDVRDASELEVCSCRAWCISPSPNWTVSSDSLSRDNTHYLICYAGTRAEQAASTLLAAGFANTSSARRHETLGSRRRTRYAFVLITALGNDLMLHNSILDAIGLTPIVRLAQFSEDLGIEVYAKLESLNPGGSPRRASPWA